MRMSTDMFGTLSDMPHGTIPHAQVTNTCLPAGQRSNKTPIFNTDVSDARKFLTWLRANIPAGLMAQLKGKKLVVVLSTTDRFRAAIRALRSLDEK
jgi:hypothetical protein